MESAVHFQGPPHGKSLPWKPPNNHPYPQSGGSTGLFCTPRPDALPIRMPNNPSWGPSTPQLPLASLCM